MEHDVREAVRPLDYSSGTSGRRRPPMSLSARIFVCVVLNVIGMWIIWGGVGIVGEGRVMSPGFGEHDRLIRFGWTVIGIGGLVAYVGLRTLKQGRSR